MCGQAVNGERSATHSRTHGKKKKKRLWKRCAPQPLLLPTHSRRRLSCVLFPPPPFDRLFSGHLSVAKTTPTHFARVFFFLCACVCPPFPFFVCSTANAAGDCDRIPAQIENSNKRKRDKKKEEQPQPLHHFPLALHRHVVLAEGMNATQPELHARVRRGREGERAEDSAGGEPLCGHHRGCCAY
jgi:hypothetical protein